ncbi:MAG: hypothetical protein ACM35H_00675 [Bacteroidota bacterium]
MAHESFDPPADSRVTSALDSLIHVMSRGRPQDISVQLGDGNGSDAVLERYAVVPNLENPRALLPLNGAGAALGTALGQHAAGAASPLVRAAARGLQLANLVGLARPLLRHRLTVASVDPERTETELHTFLSEALGRKDFVTSIRIAPRRPNGKPVVQAIDPDGTVRGYAKFGCEPLTRRLVRHEAEALRELVDLTRGTFLRVPPVLYSGEWHGMEAIVLAPLSGHPFRLRSVSDMPVDACIALAALRPRARAALGESCFWQRAKAQILDILPVLSERDRDVVMAGRDRIERWADSSLPMGQCHGDWIPANISEANDGCYNVWDWELSDSGSPLGIDAMHFVLQWELRSGRVNDALAERLLRLGRDALHHQGLDPRWAPVLVILNLLRMIILWGEARAAAPMLGEGDRRYIRVLEAVVARL